MFKYSIIIIFLGSLISCHQEKKEPLIIETLDVFDMKPQDDGYVPNNLSYSEKTYTKKNGKKIKREYFDVSRQLKGTEYYDYDKNENYGASRYLSPDGILMSRYTFEYENGKISKKLGFDGTTDELLRIENYKYNSKGFRVLKEIRDHLGSFQGSYTFSVDGFGNNRSLEIRNEKNESILKETYKIIKYNDNNEWLEMTGFINDIPTTFKRRTYE